MFKKHPMPNLESFLGKAIEKYVVVDKIGGESFSGWKGFSQIRFNRYIVLYKMSKTKNIVRKDIKR